MGCMGAKPSHSSTLHAREPSPPSAHAQTAMQGVYPAILLNLPRLPDDVYKSCVEEARLQLVPPTPEMVRSWSTAYALEQGFAV